MTTYCVFGLRVRSEIPLPELMTDGGAADPDVTIVRGDVHAVGDEPGLQGAGPSLTLVIADVGRYLIEQGCRITVDASTAVPERNVRLFLLGSAFGALLHQRGLLPLHANAVEIDGKAVAFMGESGAGKSTLAAWFHDRGHRVIADDVCVVRFDKEGRAVALPGLPRLRLWKDALTLTGRSPTDYPRSYGDDFAYEKFDVPTDQGLRARGGVELACVYLLRRGSPEIAPLTGISGAEAIIENVYRGGFAEQAGTTSVVWQNCIRLVRAAPTFRFERPWDAFEMSEAAEAAVRHAREVIAGASRMRFSASRMK